jgi:hypothetical protein
LFGGEGIDLQVLANLIACLGIKIKETSAHAVKEQNRRGKLKGVQRQQKKREAGSGLEDVEDCGALGVL